MSRGCLTSVPEDPRCFFTAGHSSPELQFLWLYFRLLSASSSTLLLQGSLPSQDLKPITSMQPHIKLPYKAAWPQMLGLAEVLWGDCHSMSQGNPIFKLCLPSCFQIMYLFTYSQQGRKFLSSPQTQPHCFVLF